MARAVDRVPAGREVLTGIGRMIAAAGALLALLAFFGGPASATPKPPDPPPPIVVDPIGGGDSTVGIGVHGPGGDGNGGGDNNGVQTDPCAADPGSTGCVAQQNAHKCSAVAADWAGASRPGGTIGTLGNLSPTELAELNADLAANGCPPWKGGGAPLTAAELAQDAYGQLRLPTPMPSRYPTGTLQDGRPDTIVNTHMWFATDGSGWKPTAKTVCAGTLCATATARPTTLSLDPGNGDAAVSCPGPGTRWVRPAHGSWVPGEQPQGCDYQYTRSTYKLPHGELTAVYTITWTVTWTGTNGTSGTLDPLRTAATSTFAVAELQTVVTR